MLYRAGRIVLDRTRVGKYGCREHPRPHSLNVYRPLHDGLDPKGQKCNLDEYVERTAADGAYASSLEMNAVARIFAIRITVGVQLRPL